MVVEQNLHVRKGVKEVEGYRDIEVINIYTICHVITHSVMYREEEITVSR